MNRTKKIGWVVFFLCVSLWGAPYTDNGNGTVTDSTTGLIWQKCTKGLGTEVVGNCFSGIVDFNSWSSAYIYCKGLILGSRNDWRLPNINELESIIDYSKPSNPTIDTTAFPNTKSSYWSSTRYAQNTNYVYYVDFTIGQVSFINGLLFTNQQNYHYVRCVTGP